MLMQKLCDLRWLKHTYTYVCDWIFKNWSKLHKNWNPIYCWTLNLNSCTNQKHQTHGCRWPSLLSQIAFCCPCQPPRCTTGSLGPVNGINKDVSGARMLPTTVSTYPMDWVCFRHLLKTQHHCLCPNGRYNLQLPTHPHRPSDPLSSADPL